MGFAWGLVVVIVLALLDASSDQRTHAPAPAPQVAQSSAPNPAASASARNVDAGAALLAHRHLVVPVEGVARSQLHDTFDAGRGKGRRHQAIDIMAARGTPVLAADDGRVAKISSNRGGGLALYLVDPSGHLVYYYAHLDGYAAGLHEGQPVHRGDVVGYVGSTGNAPESAPHLHFAVLLLASERRWWGGEAINPFAALTGGETLAASSATAEPREARAARPTR